MAEHTQSPDDLYLFAEALVLQIVKRYHLRWDNRRKQDAAQDLFLAGWQAWCEEGEVGLAKNRMTSRQKNLLRGDRSELRHEPKTESHFPQSDEGEPGPLDRGHRRAEFCGNPAEEALVNDYLTPLTGIPNSGDTIRNSRRETALFFTECQADPSLRSLRFLMFRRTFRRAKNPL